MNNAVKIKLENGTEMDRARVAFALKEGNAWNPLLNYPRNSPCFCNSGKKFKKCHLDTIPRFTSKAEAAKWKRAMDKVLGASK
jgi:hypothetical protein